MWWIGLALAGGPERLDGKVTRAVESCGDEEACLLQVEAKYRPKAVKKGWDVPALIALQKSLGQRAEERIMAADRERARAEFEALSKAPPTEETLDAIDEHISKYAELDGYDLLSVMGLRHTVATEVFTVKPDIVWEATVNKRVEVDSGTPPRMKRLSNKRSKDTDVATWLQSNGLEVPAAEPAKLPRNPAVVPLGNNTWGPPDQIVSAGDAPVAVWSKHGVATQLPEKRAPRTFDLSALARAPEVTEGDEAYVEQEITWATVVGGVVYVASSHRTYAKSSGGMNAYITAFDIGTGAMMWRSQPLVANARNFVVHGGWIITGYGFTAEPDYLYVLDRADGSVQQKVKVANGPEWMLVRDDVLYVRTYDRDYTFALQ